MTKERILAMGLVVMTVAVVLLAWMAFFHEPKVVRARAFELVDADGRRVALLGMSEEGTTALAFWDSEDRLRASLGVLPDGQPLCVLHDESGNPIDAAR